MENREITYNAIYPNSIYWLVKDNKGTKGIRTILEKSNKNKTIGQQKWSDELALGDEFDWKRMFLMAKDCNVNARIRFFNYQILQRSLITNRKLFLFKMVEQEKCDNCNFTETIAHLLYDCENAQKVWVDLDRWIEMNMNEKVILDKQSILLGNPKKLNSSKCYSNSNKTWNVQR